MEEWRKSDWEIRMRTIEEKIEEVEKKMNELIEIWEKKRNVSTDKEYSEEERSIGRASRSRRYV